MDGWLRDASCSVSGCYRPSAVEHPSRNTVPHHSNPNSPAPGMAGSRRAARRRWQPAATAGSRAPGAPRRLHGKLLTNMPGRGSGRDAVQVIWRQCGILIPALLFCGCVRPADQPDGLNLQQGSSHRGGSGAGAARTKGERVQCRRSITETWEAASHIQERGAAQGCARAPERPHVHSRLAMTHFTAASEASLLSTDIKSLRGVAIAAQGKSCAGCSAGGHLQAARRCCTGLGSDRGRS